MSAAQFAYDYTKRLSFGLVYIPNGSKAPIGKAWQDNPVTDPEQAKQIWANGGGMGLLHAAANTCTIDVDHLEFLELAAASLDIDLMAFIRNAAVAIKGAKGTKPLFRVPDGMSLNYHKLIWPHPTELTEKGKPRMVTVVEFRAGHGKQDVLPPTIHKDTGRPYEWVGTPPRQLSDIPELPPELLAFWEELDAHMLIMRAACPWAPAPVAPTFVRPTDAARVTYGTGEGVIGQFKSDDLLDRELQAEGYIQVQQERWLSPHSSTGDAAVVTYRDEHGVKRACTYHASDDWSDQKGHDAFDLFCHFRHGGDVRAAVKAAATELGIDYASNRPTAPVETDLTQILTNWSDHGTEVLEAALTALGMTNMHHQARQACINLLANILMKGMEGNIKIIQGEICLMVGGMNMLSAELRCRPADTSSRLKLLASHGFLGAVRHLDPSDPRSPLMLIIPADPRGLTFLKLTPEGLQSLNLRPSTVDSRRSESRKDRKPPVVTHGMAKATGGLRPKPAVNPLQSAMRVALIVSRHPGLTLKEISKRAGCQTATARKHLAVLEEAGLARGSRLLVTFQEFFKLARAAVAEQIEGRYRSLMEHARRFASKSLLLARLGVPECIRTAPARMRLLKKANEVLGTPTEGSYAHTLRLSA